METVTDHRPPGELGHGAVCRVCLKPIAPNDKRWTVHYRGTEYAVCCPSCVQAFNRAPQQFVDPA